jgi:hypothetical protein
LEDLYPFNVLVARNSVLCRWKPFGTKNFIISVKWEISVN